MKICSTCKIEKSFLEFRKRKALKDGHSSLCKQCLEIARLANKHEPKNIVTTIYAHQKQLSIHRGYTLPNYTKKELLTWLLNQSNFKKLCMNWKLSSYSKWLKPSCDRLDDYKPYTLTNIQLVTWKENKDNYHISVKTGINTKQCTAINQLDINTKTIIASFVSVQIASTITGIRRTNISQCLTGKQNTAGGYIWEYI